MNLIPIKKESRLKNGEAIEVFVVPAISFNLPDGKVKKVPHPEGYDTIVYLSFEKAKEAVAAQGFSYSQHKSETRLATSDLSCLTDPLIELLKDKSIEVVCAAIFSLGEIASPEAIIPLINLLDREDNNLRKAIIEALAKIGEPSLEPLVNLLNDSNWIKRSSAAVCIGEISLYCPLGLTNAIAPLVNALKDSNSIVRSSSAISLGKIYKTLKTQSKQ